MAITLRRAQAFSKLNSPQQDDFDVMDGSRRIGRVFHTEAESGRWSWSLSTAIRAGGMSGRAATRVLALEALADAYNAVNVLNGTEYEHRLPAPSPESLVRRSIRMIVKSF